MTKVLKWTIAALLPLAALAQETITLRDGTTFDGRMVSATERSVTFRDNSGQMHQLDVDQLDSIRFYNDNHTNSLGNNYQGNNANTPADSRYGGSYANGGSSMTLPAGTSIAVRTNQTIDTRDASQSTSYSAQVARDVLDPNGDVMIPQGSEARLIVRKADGNNLALDLESVRVNERVYTVDTSDVRAKNDRGLGTNKRTGEFVGGGAVLGTLLGAIAGGGKGAAIGALAGAGAGAGTQVLTKGDQVRVPAESVLTFRLDSPLRLSVAQ